jgi:hypothetical protein
MDDNAASHDITISEVHPDTRAGADSNPNNEDKEREINDAVELLAKDDVVDGSGGDQDGQRESEIPPQPSASPPPAPPPIKSPTPEPTSTAPQRVTSGVEEHRTAGSTTEEAAPATQEDSNDIASQNQQQSFMDTREGEGDLNIETLSNLTPHVSTSTDEPEREKSSVEEPQTTAGSTEETAPAQPQEDGTDGASQSQEQLFLNTGDDEEGLDPDTLANLAALSRLARDEGDGDEDDENEGVSGGDNDFSTLLGDSQHSMTREQMQDIVARLAQHGDDDQDAEGEDDLDIDAEGEDEYPEDRQDGDAVKQKREDSEDLREVDDQRGSKNEGGDTKSERSRKRKRNRTVL